jgi:hypothetical protein
MHRSAYSLVDVMQNTLTGNSNSRRRFRGYGELFFGILGLVAAGFDLRAYLQVGQVDTGKHRIFLQGSDAWPCGVKGGVRASKIARGYVTDCP